MSDFNSELLPLSGTPYVVEENFAKEFVGRLENEEARVNLLRKAGTLNEGTLLDYYGEKRFEQVAESNAIEGSTLDVGETELAVLKGITITGHDPAFARDAVALNKALDRLVEIARGRSEPSSITNLLELHGLILGDRPGGGQFRNERVRIRGSDHTPPKTWEEVMSAMQDWENWSLENLSAPAPIRAAVLHAWLAHIHPFIDGNGRTARAITNLELVRAGYPPIIVRKKERERYIESLAESDSAGDISSFLDLILERVDGALTGLELSAKKQQSFDPIAIRVRESQSRQLEVWNRSVSLLSAMIELNLSKAINVAGGKVFKRDFAGVADVDDFITLCGGSSISSSWAFIFSINIPGVEQLEFLAFIGHRGYTLYNYLQKEGGPSIHWSIAKSNTIPKWQKALDEAPYAKEVTTRLGRGDNWVAVKKDNQIVEHTTSELAELIAGDMLSALENRLF